MRAVERISEEEIKYLMKNKDREPIGGAFTAMWLEPAPASSLIVVVCLLFSSYNDRTAVVVQKSSGVFAFVPFILLCLSLVFLSSYYPHFISRISS